jgi:GntR family transcriptional regulator, rspAB operon transcriptional repressor
METKVIKPSRLASPVRPGAESLSDRAYLQIRDEILRGDLSIGDVLSRRKIAERLNMSFLPITEALQRLETDGLVESKPRIGTRVRIPTEQNIRDSYVIREALESQAARLCAEHISDDDRKEMRMGAQHLDQLYAISVPESGHSMFMFSLHTYHMQFHLRIAELARCPGLRIAIEREQVLVFNWLYDTAARRHTVPPGFHSSLAAALSSGDALKADKAMRLHVRYGLEQVLESLASFDYEKSWRLKTVTK